MSKAVKLKNDNYLDSTSIVHNKSRLSKILDKILGIETIENENGKAIKFSDGTMICTNNIKLTNFNIDGSWGNMYKSENIQLGNFAVPFKERPISIKASTHEGYASIVGNIQLTSATSAGVTLLFSGLKQLGQMYTISYLAIGNWK